MTKEEKEELIRQKENLKLLFELSKFLPTAAVSYTHLDVYKRQ